MGCAGDGGAIESTDDGSTTASAATSDSADPVGDGSTSSGVADGTTTSTTADASESTSGSTGNPECVTPAECAEDAQAQTAAWLEEIRDDPTELAAFLTAMPLGGDLHHHLSGAVYAEAYLAWADADGGFCVTSSSLSLSTACGDGNDVPVPTGRRDLYLDVVRAWSMADFVPTPTESGADHFFATFAKFGAISGTRHGSMLANVRQRAANENVQYIEPMLTSNATARTLGQAVWQGLGGGALAQDEYATLHAAIVADPGFVAARDVLVDEVADSEAIADAEQACASAQPAAGCDVATRHQAYISRSGSDAEIFGQMVAAYEAAIVEPRLVGLNLVGPEYGSTAMSNYDQLMDMLAYLQGAYEGVSPLRLSLHAGEITAATIPAGYALDEADHVRKAFEVAGARRIGHGVDVLYESDPQGLLADLAAAGVLVEICLASNDIILEVNGDEHPLHDFLAQGVPVALATDDQGVARSSLAAEYGRAVVDLGLGYLELKAMARNSLHYAFLPGESLWEDLPQLTITNACAPARGETPTSQPPSAACQALLDASARASQEHELERRFAEFEAQIAGG